MICPKCKFVCVGHCIRENVWKWIYVSSNCFEEPYVYLEWTRWFWTLVDFVHEGKGLDSHGVDSGVSVAVPLFMDCVYKWYAHVLFDLPNDPSDAGNMTELHNMIWKLSHNPATARHTNVLILMLYIPEFQCMFSMETYSSDSSLCRFLGLYFTSLEYVTTTTTPTHLSSLILHNPRQASNIYTNHR